MSAADVTPEEAELWERIREAQRGRLRAAMFRVDTVATLIGERDQLRSQLASRPAPVAVEVPVVLDGGVGTIDMELVRIGYAWLDHRAGKEICSDRTCIRCRLADILAQVEKELALRSGEAEGRMG